MYLILFLYIKIHLNFKENYMLDFLAIHVTQATIKPTKQNVKKYKQL